MAAPQRETHLIYCLHPPRGGNGYCFISIGYFNLNGTGSCNDDRGRMREGEREGERFGGRERQRCNLTLQMISLSLSLFFSPGLIVDTVPLKGIALLAES